MRPAFLSPLAIARRQAVCIGLAAVVAAFFWANGEPVNLGIILLYALVIGNLIVPSFLALSPLYFKRRFPYNWIAFLLIVFVLLFPAYLLSSLAVWLFASPADETFQARLMNWKFPVMATVVFSVVTHLFRITKSRLEQRNKELQQSVEIGNAQIQMQEQELERAHEIQQSLLPKQIPQIHGFDVAGAWRPARAVSGDYYDVFKLDAHKLGVCIADVSGKGVSAALLMANVQAAVRAYANDAEGPAALCGKVNVLLLENIAIGKFVTFLYGVLDNEAHTFRYCNAGHLYPILVSQGEAHPVNHCGAVLGVFPDWKYEEAAIPLEPGDRLLLFTDGITEACGLDDEEYGESRLAEFARAQCRYSADEINSLLLERVSEFCHEHFQDDATLLVIAAN